MPIKLYPCLMMEKTTQLSKIIFGIIYFSLNFIFKNNFAPTLQVFTTFLITVILAVILIVTHKTFINAQAIPTVKSGSRAQQRILCCENKKARFLFKLEVVGRVIVLQKLLHIVCCSHIKPLCHFLRTAHSHTWYCCLDSRLVKIG